MFFALVIVVHIKKIMLDCHINILAITGDR
ncbi:hypothetical protein DLNHIDIE_02439 [Acidithiobacillus thiooxidans ATCC 19377]|uniref:Uncharacterized protein n=1 Tax=Acidithiobacillus thiooxidans ATCC 19377 TaxID=637390 RepID=A0A543Q888_ACITH|nr:hypothetical protein DLNHIDIE_02439 [Acidithiobacillus thiooxidans ATCC 19377]